ncbi:MAG TPA: TetR/AcrR family transcriptional regulator [Streptosporangiaceae bacterium]|nr:TetR/AcrR family transcriptional regulator [Streptosporangiaceae bacterium]
MGNREDLLAGAKRCLIEKGYARTTARDIASASGVSLAAIGYHFGSKDALMNQAVFESIGDWADELQRLLTAEGGEAVAPLERFELIMQQTLASFAGPSRGLWTAQLELLSLAQHNPQLQAFLASVQDLAESGLAEMFLGLSAGQDPAASKAAGTVIQAFFIGLIAKYYLNPAGMRSARDLADGMRIVAQRMLASGDGD